MPAWHTFYVLGAMTAYLLMLRLARKHDPELSQVDLSRLFVICYVGGYLGARFLSVLVEEDPDGLLDVLAALVSLGPMTFYGGAIGAGLAGLLYARLCRLSYLRLLDVAVPPGLAALAIGRIGCFLNGDDYGKAVALQGAEAPWWSVTFPNLGDGVARYPVQLISFAGALALSLLLCTKFRLLREKRGMGAVGLTGILAYAIFRFLVEFLRGDPRGELLGLSTSQWISASLLVLLGLVAALRPLTWRA